MKICLVSSSFYPAFSYGGPVFSTRDLCKHLGSQGIQIYVSTTNANGKERLKKVNTKLHEKVFKNVWVRYYHEQFLNLFSFNFLLNVWRDIRDADIVYIQYIFSYTVPIALFYSFLFRKKVVLCPRGSFSDFTLSYRFSFLKNIWIYLLIKPFRNIINWHACSYLEKNDILSFFPNSNVEIITDGVDYDNFQSSLLFSNEEIIERLTGQKFDKVSDVIVSIGRIHHINRFDVLINAFNLFLKDQPNAKLIIAGEDDGMKTEIEHQIVNLGLIDSVFLIGFVDHNQKKELLTNATFFVLSSDFESFGIVIIEALACGCPVVVSNKTPWKDLGKNKCGIFTANDEQSFYVAFKQISRVTINKESCRDYVVDNFDWSIVTGSFLHFLKRIS